MTKKYTTAWVIGPGRYDLSGLMDLVEQVKFVTAGKNLPFEAISADIHAMKGDFNPKKDLIVPVGRMLGIWLAADILLNGVEWYNLAVYSDDDGTYEAITINRRQG